MKLTVVLLLGAIISIKTTTAQYDDTNSSDRSCICVPIYDCGPQIGELVFERLQPCAIDEICCFQPLPNATTTGQVPLRVTPESNEFIQPRSASGLFRYEEQHSVDCICVPYYNCDEETKTIKLWEESSAIVPKLGPSTRCENVNEICCTPIYETSPVEKLPSTPTSSVIPAQIEPQVCICVPYYNCDEETKTIKLWEESSAIIPKIGPSTHCPNPDEICCTPTNATSPVEKSPSTRTPKSPGFINILESTHSSTQEEESLIGCVCVPYHDCDEETNIIKPENSKGIKERFKPSTICEHTGYVCCSLLARNVTTFETDHNCLCVPAENCSSDISLRSGCKNQNEVCCSEKTFLDYQTTTTEVYKMHTTTSSLNHIPIVPIKDDRSGRTTKCGIYDEEYSPAFPWEVLISSETHRTCFGSLIHPEVILTSRSCIQKDQINSVKIHPFEANNGTTENREFRIVSALIRHKDRTSDIAMMKLNAPFSNNARIICLPEKNSEIPKEGCIINFEHDNSTIENIIMENIPAEKCQKYLYSSIHNINNLICEKPTKDVNLSKGVADGSSLVYLQPNYSNRYVQAGILSPGFNSRENRQPRAFINVALYREWIDSEMRNMNLDTSTYILD